jgi:hypothetical protein
MMPMSTPSLEDKPTPQQEGVSDETKVQIQRKLDMYKGRVALRQQI